ncbi:MAG: type II toxin-antitoxin system HipA family toxin YjjJ [Bdellovibrionota bacterium]
MAVENAKQELLAYLRKNGQTTTKTLCQILELSQASLSRILSSIKDQIVVMGKARETTYAAVRKIDDLPQVIPIFEIQENGSCRRMGILCAVEPQGFYFESQIPEIKSALFPDLPYFLNDIRPTGFLGRLIPQLNEDLQLPKDILLWNANHCLKYLCLRGWDNTGNFIVGEKAFQLYLENCQQIKNAVEIKQRKRQYSQFANNILSIGIAGSSAGGEQPKFTTTLMPKCESVIVKFSPKIDTEIGQRVADLFMCEHIALQVLKKNSINSAESEIISHDSRIFLEVKRFDRTQQFGRRSLISLASLDAEFTGVLGTWSQTSVALEKNKIIPQSCLEKIRLLALFGELIANNDMHLYNLSFFMQSLQVTQLAPVYDMLPMLFMPRNNQIIQTKFTPPLPKPEDGKIWPLAYKMALEFWSEVLKKEQISTSFKKTATECQNKIKEIKILMHKLPKN